MHGNRNAFGRRRLWVLAGTLICLLAAGVAAFRVVTGVHRASEEVGETAIAPAAPADEAQIQELCSHCHLRPPPDALPKSSWEKTVWTMSHFGGFGANVPEKVNPEAVANWYRARAPDKLDLPPVTTAQGPGRLRLRKQPIYSTKTDSHPFVSNIRIAQLVGDPRPEMVVCDMRNGAVLLGRTDRPDWRLEPIAEVPYPAHAAPVDLDADGRPDLVVSNLGSFLAMDHKLGSVEWLHQTSDARFERIALATDLGRVASVQPGDVDADGDVDLVVAEFGWRWTGHLVLLENRSQPGQPPTFIYRALDGLHGNSHLAIADLDGDGLLDIMALYSQEHEMVRGYLNRKQLAFEARDLYRAPHPAWGSSGFEMTDLDQDGDLDVLITNGDTYDDSLLKPYHGIRWLENRGSLRFQPHDLVRMYGVYRAEAGDLDQDGDMDIVACALAESDDIENNRDAIQFESVLWLEQTSKGVFVHHTWESAACQHPNLAVGDFDLDGDPDVFVGNGTFDNTRVADSAPCVDLWENLASEG